MSPEHFDRRRVRAVELSALWAAWGDALGFQSHRISDRGDLRRSIGSETVHRSVPLRRRVGDPGGVEVELPAGTYADLTQLRLAVSRCRRSTNTFDSEAFTKVELGVFLSYQYGTATQTRTAAQALHRRTARWSRNFYATNGVRYVDAADGEAAARVQPHVWAAASAHPEEYLPWVLRDTLATHGHPSALLAALFHALCVGTALREQQVPGPDRWPAMISDLGLVTSQMGRYRGFPRRWFSQWQSQSGTSWENVLSAAIRDAGQLTHAAIRTARSNEATTGRAYGRLMSRMGGLDVQAEHAGFVCALAAAYLAWAHRDDPASGVRLAADLLGSHTDVVAGMAGAVLGCVADSEPDDELLDRRYIRLEAGRVATAAASADPTTDFPHPDPLHWQTPRTQSDAVGFVEEQTFVAGLGPSEALSAPFASTHDVGVGWQWQRLWTGQTLLIKRRARLSALPSDLLPQPRGGVETLEFEEDSVDNEQEHARSGAPASFRERLPDNPADGVALWLQSGRDDELLGNLVRRYATGEHGVQLAAVFGGLIAQEIATRDGHLPHQPSLFDGVI